MSEPRDTIPGYEGTVGPFPSQYGQRHVYARDVQSGAGNCVCGRSESHQIHVTGPDCTLDGDVAMWWIADARTTVLLHGASRVGREIELVVESYDGSVRLTDDQALRVADALREAATWKRSLADRVPFDVEAGLADIVGTDPEDR